jgi:hypothetical protein
MAEQFIGKRIPKVQLDEYLRLHQGTILSCLDQLKHNLADVPEIEGKIPKSFFQIHELTGRILRENNILPNDQESDKLQMIIKIVMKLQSTLIS